MGLDRITPTILMQSLAEWCLPARASTVARAASHILLSSPPSYRKELLGHRLQKPLFLEKALGTSTRDHQMNNHVAYINEKLSSEIDQRNSSLKCNLFILRDLD